MLLVTLLAFSGPTRGDDDSILATGPGRFPHEASDLPVDPEVRWGRLNNGLRYMIRASHEPKDRASLRLAVTAGSLNETEDQRGLAHFLEHLAFNGSTHFAPGTLVEYFQRLGMSFGGDTNAFTSFDRTEYQLELPDTKPETLDQAFTLFADYGGGLLLQPQSIEKERGIILSEQRARDSVGYRESVDELKFLLPHARLPERMPIGLTDVIEHAQRDRFVDFYQAWYRPENIIVVVVGDFDPAAVELQLVSKLSMLVPAKPVRPPPALDTVVPLEGVVARLHADPDAPATHVSIESVSPWRMTPDLASTRLKYLPRDLAVMMLNRRLAIRAKQEGAPFSEGEAAVTEQNHFFRNASIGLTCKPEQWRDALGVAEQELRRALQFGFQPAELREAVAGLGNALDQAANAAPTRRSRELADAMVESVLDGKVFTTPSIDRDLIQPALAKVTVADCAEALRAAWSETPGRYLYVSGNLALAEPSKEILTAYAASRAVAVTPPPTTKDATFAYTDFGPRGTAIAYDHLDDLDVTLIKFTNGVRLNVKPTKFETNRVYVSVRLGGGRLTQPKDQPGLATLAEGIFSPGGLGLHSADDLQRILAGKTVGWEFGVANDAFVFQGATNSTDLLLELQLLCAYVTDPGYRPEAFREFQKAVEQTYTQLGHTVEGPLQAEIPQLMADGDNRFGLPPRAVMDARTVEEVRAWLTPQLAAGPIEVAITGDIEPSMAMEAVASTFGALPARCAKPAYSAERRVRFPSAPLDRHFAVSTEIPRGIVELQWPATDARDVGRARRLSLLGAVLNDRLRVKLREQMGETYSPEAGVDLSDTFPGYGFLVAQATVAPANAPAVVEAMKSVAADLARKGVTEDELRRAKQPVLTGLRDSARTNGYWLHSVLASAQEQPMRLDWCRTRLTDYESITKFELDSLAARYLDPARASEFIIVPEAKDK